MPPGTNVDPRDGPRRARLRVAVFAALEWECRTALAALERAERRRDLSSHVRSGSCAGIEMWVARTGIGPHRAAATARRIAEQGRFDLFVSAGCAGAIVPELEPGALVIGTHVVALGDGEHFATSTADRDRAERAARAATDQVLLGGIASSDVVLATPETRAAAASAACALAVEMEAAGIARVARDTATPFLAVRSILDDIDVQVDGDLLVDPEHGTVRPLAAARHLLRHPARIRNLLALERMRRASATALERFFVRFLLEAAAVTTGGAASREASNR